MKAHHVTPMVAAAWLVCGTSSCAEDEAIRRQPTWATSLGGAGDDSLAAVTAAADGGWVTVGATTSVGVGEVDAWIVKVNAAGRPLWQRALGSPGIDALFSVVRTNDDGFCAAGQLDGDGAWIVRLDAQGDVVWQKVVGRYYSARFQAVRETVDGGLVAVGQILFYGEPVAWIVRFDGAGNLLWQETFGPSTGRRDSVFTSVETTADGGYVIVGNTDNYFGNEKGGLLLRLDAGGGRMWARVYGGNAADSFFAVQPSARGTWVVAGRTESLGSPGGNAWLLEIGDNGDLRWQRTYGEGQPLTDVRALAPGRHVIVGPAAPWGSGGARVSLVDDDGEAVWQKVYSENGNDRLAAVAVAEDGGLVTVGTRMSELGRLDGWWLRIGTDGSVADLDGDCYGVGPTTTVSPLADESAMESAGAASVDALAVVTSIP